MCKHCPLGYCKAAAVNESLCTNNRTGIVCGQCKDSFSIVFGNSRCIKCSKYAFLWLVPLFAVMGLFLVLGMLFLDLTVSIGLINGLIFYANILSISGLTNNYNCSIHPLLSVFISWVNLDFGIETCFYSGMDMYQKTWLQFAFPLVHMVTSGSDHHTQPLLHTSDETPWKKSHPSTDYFVLAVLP